jgi:uncharacterized membrane protein YfcA
MLGIPSAQLAILAAAVAGSGAVTGLLAGLFGVGGGTVIVPVLYEVFGMLDVPESIRMQMCIGTSLAIIVPTSIRSYRAHRAKGMVLEGVLRLWTVPAVVGVAIGAAAAAFAPAGIFKGMFAVIAGTIAVKLLSGRSDWRLADDLPGPTVMRVYGFVVGLCSSMMGVGGGAISNMVMALYNRPIHNSVATASGLGVPISVCGSIGFMIAGLSRQDVLPPLSIGFVSIVGLILMAPISSYVAGHGVRIAHALPRRYLEIAFGLFLLTAALRFVATFLW